MTPDADELLRRLTLSRLAERFGDLPYSAQYHILHCTPITVHDLGAEPGVGLCGTCELTQLTALISCVHTQVEFHYAQDGRLDQLIADLIAEAESAS